MGVWHGITLLLRHRLACRDLGWEGIPSIGLVRGRDTGIDGRWQQASGVWGRGLPLGLVICYDRLHDMLSSCQGMSCAGVGSGANQEHAGGESLALLVLIQPD